MSRTLLSAFHTNFNIFFFVHYDCCSHLQLVCCCKRTGVRRFLNKFNCKITDCVSTSFSYVYDNRNYKRHK